MVKVEIAARAIVDLDTGSIIVTLGGGELCSKYEYGRVPLPLSQSWRCRQHGFITSRRDCLYYLVLRFT